METIKYVHLTSVLLFLIHYLVKTGMLLANSAGLEGYTKKTKVIEMIISVTFLGTGGYLLLELPEVNNLMIIKLCMVFASIPIAIVGFKRKNKILAVLALALIIGSYGMAEMGRAKREKGTATVSVDGKEIFTLNCSKCHGDDGKAMLMGAPDLSISAIDVNAAAVLIEEGKGMMTPFKGTLTPEQIQAVAKYAQTLKK